MLGLSDPHRSSVAIRGEPLHCAFNVLHAGAYFELVFRDVVDAGFMDRQGVAVARVLGRKLFLAK